MQINGNLDTSGRLTLHAGDTSIAIQASTCTPETDTLQQCFGQISLLLRSKSAPEQTIEISSFFLDGAATLYYGSLDAGATVSRHSILLSDVNNDGIADLLLWTGKEGAYGGPSYDVYLMDTTSGKFQYSAEFSELTVGYNGLFTTEGNKIKTVASSGCCVHVFETYELQNRLPVLIERLTEDSTDPNHPVKTKEVLVDGTLQKIHVE